MRDCWFCSQPIAEGRDYFQQVVGWVATGKRDNLTLREDVVPPRYAHKSCVTLKSLGVSAGQESLIPGSPRSSV